MFNGISLPSFPVWSVQREKLSETLNHPLEENIPLQPKQMAADYSLSILV